MIEEEMSLSSEQKAQTIPPSREVSKRKRWALLGGSGLVIAQIYLSYEILVWLAPRLIPSPIMGLEGLRASLFERGISLADGFAHPLFGPLVSQMLWFKGLILNLIVGDEALSFDPSLIGLTTLSLVGILWGSSLLFQRRRLTFISGLIGLLVITPQLREPAEHLWMMMIYTWVGVGFTASWRHPSSFKWSILCGFTLSLGVAATPLFAPLAILYFCLTFFPRPMDPSVSILRRIAWLTPVGAVIGFGMGMTPWLFKGNLSQAPLTLEQYTSPKVWSYALDSINPWMSVDTLLVAFGPLLLMAAFTFMSAHISGAPWSRRGIGLAGLGLLALTYQPLLGGGLLIAPLVWIAIHPWSPIGTFVLLPFKPSVKRSISLIVFGMIFALPSVHSYQELSEGLQAPRTEIEEELVKISDYLEKQSALKSVWAVGRGSASIYSMNRLKGSALLPMINQGGEEQLRLKGALGVIVTEQIDVILISEETSSLAMKTTGLERLLEQSYRQIPASDYQWLSPSRFNLFLRGQQDKPQPMRATPLSPPVRIEALEVPSPPPIRTPRSLPIVTPSIETDIGGASASDADKEDADKGDADEGDADEGDADEGDADEGDADEGDADEGDADKGDADKGDADKEDADEGDADKGDADKGDAGKGDADKKGADEEDADEEDADKGDADKVKDKEDTKRPAPSGEVQSKSTPQNPPTKGVRSHQRGKQRTQTKAPSGKQVRGSTKKGRPSKQAK